ncbi:hypothetical protein F5148DRAFT_480943 [Russula earlei]|uniref:Uncharacterized protein n=1 Tax=Russula earlei TaxID=71964 RepID=A0ACC0UIN4_9AGAM|nr:hypothetical protein F5148DRAFT_480943 [Russula earlei]
MMHLTRGTLRSCFCSLPNPTRATLPHHASVSDSYHKTSSRLFTRKSAKSPHDALTSKSSIALIRNYSQVQSTESSSADNSSIFSPKTSPWDHVFEDVPTRHPLIPIAREKPTRVGLSNSSLEPRRQTMTSGELSVFDDMFNMIFAAANERRLAEDGASAAVDINTRSPLSRFLKTLPKYPRLRQTSEDAELDKLKEQLALCPSDYAMLEWAEREVFGASIRAEEAARAAFSAGKPPPRHLQPHVYPHLLAALMSTARERYGDPHLALSLFEHARNLSPLSYIFGCTTPAYNELLETRWDSFRDLRGVYSALHEMRANGVPSDSRTRALVDDVRREIGARTLWLEESEMGSGEVWTMLGEIEHLAARSAARQTSMSDHRPRQQQLPHDVWKNPELIADQDAAYRFGEWPDSGSRWQAQKRASQFS